MPNRQAMLQKLDGTFDLLVIGGGITGAGIARDAARRGLRVALVEMCDLAYGTSSRSSKLVHGGLRYLEQYEFSLVFESVSERKILQDIAPHLVSPLGFLFPVYEGQRHHLWVISAGMWLYDALSLFRSPKVHRTLGPKALKAAEPALRQEALKGAPLYYDCATDDARLTLENAICAAQAGAVVCTWTKVTRLMEDGAGRAVGAVLRDELSGQERSVRAHTVINATGPWTDETRSMGGEAAQVLRPTKGVHIVVNRRLLPLHHAVVCFHPDDGRVLFAVPWGERTYVGTTDTDYGGDPGDVHATLSDVDYLLQAASAYFPNYPLQRQDVISTWAGVRPLVAPPQPGGGASQVSREHQVLVESNGMITIAGGKLTTYRKMAAEVVDTALGLLAVAGQGPSALANPETEKRPLPGGEGWPDDDDIDKVIADIAAAGGESVPADVAQHLARTYGMRGRDLAGLAAAQPELAVRLIPGRPEIMAEVDWAVREEFAATLDDVMTRRTQLFFRVRDQGLAAAPFINRRLQQLLGWSDEQAERELQRYHEEVARSRRWQTAAAAQTPAYLPPPT